MKTFLFAVLMVASVPAFADNFGCMLQVGNAKEAALAEYRVRNADVTLRPFLCSGDIADNGTVTAKISSTLNGDYKVSQGFTSVTVSKDGAVCFCGMQ